MRLWRQLSEPQRRTIVQTLNDDDLALLHFNTRYDDTDLRNCGWWTGARDNQIEPEGATWVYWVAMAGRGWGKTRTGAEWVRSYVDGGRAGRIALIAKDPGEARDVMIEGESGLLSVCVPTDSTIAKKFRPKYNSSIKRIEWPNGALATAYSSENCEELRGPQHDLAWTDELGKFRYATETLDQMLFGLRLGLHPRALFTTTPRPIPAMRRILADPLTVVTHGTTYENLSNLSKAYRSVIAQYEGTRLGRQELNAEMLLDTPGALWTLDLLDRQRVLHTPDDLARVVVGVDPSGNANDFDEGTETGIVVAGRRQNSNACFVLEDKSCRGTPKQWAQEVARAYYAHRADRVVAEANFGGEMVRAVIEAQDPSIRVELVHASRGKIARAEPISTRYEAGDVHHVGTFALMEDEMCTYNPLMIGTKQKSPNRMDALVWALTDLYDIGLIDMDNAELYGTTPIIPEPFITSNNNGPWLTTGAM